MTRQSGQGRPRLPAIDWVRCRGGKERAFCQTQTHGLPSAGRAQIYYHRYHRQVRFGHAVSSRTVASRLVLRQPTDANLYAPSVNEASKTTTIRESVKCFFCFLLLAFSYSSSRNSFRCHPDPEAGGTQGITVPDCFHLVAHCADAAGRTMLPHRRVLMHLASYQIILPGSAFPSSKYRSLPILHVFYSITNRLVKIYMEKDYSLSTSPANQSGSRVPMTQ